MADDVLGGVVSRSSDLIILAIKKTWYFKSKFSEMEATVNRMRRIIKEIEELNREMDRHKEETVRINNMLKQADNLVLKCQKIKWLFWKKFYYDSKLDEMNQSLTNYLRSDIILQIARDVKYIRAASKRVLEQGGPSSGAPLLKGGVIGFDDRVKNLKNMLFKDCPNDDCSIVVVSAPGGSGKTTLVDLLCNDPDIKERFGDKNIHYAIVSQNYNKKVVVTKLLGGRPSYTTNEDAIQQWGSFLSKNESEILLVLDDVWSDEVIDDFKFKLPRYKILVTSRITFKQFKTYQLQVLNDQDSTHLFRRSAFSRESRYKDSNIPDGLFDELVKCCKNHPMVLSIIGRMLNGAHLASWELMLKNLSEEKKPFLDMNETILECLERSLFLFDKKPEMKQYFMHLGIFPEDQKIAASTLMDMWVHLYNHDEEGLDTMNILDRLSSKNLATLLPLRKHSRAIVNRCEEEFVTQHDMMRELAIRSSNEERDILIINAYGKDLSQLPQTVNARVLSISTDEKCPLIWYKIKAPKAEVFVLNYMSKVHPLPKFVHKKNRLKVLIITNYGYYFSEIQNFPTHKYLSGLTRIRLDHVSISLTISTTILMLENLQKLSLIMCKIGNSFNEGILNKLTSLLEIDIDSCDDLVTFPSVLCNSIQLKKLSITNCHELTSLPDELGKLLHLEVLRVASCSNFTPMPESVTNLKKLRIIDISHCLRLCELPNNIGELHSLQTIYATNCMSLTTLPKSVENLNEIHLVCDEETSHRLGDFKNVKIEVVREDPVDTFFKINPRGH